MSTGPDSSNADSERELKQLLFSRELRMLSDLQTKADRLDARVGDGPALTRSVETVLVEVLRSAQERDHERVASALAPLIVSSMRSEIRNSRDMMVEALYPITGRLVAAAVKDAIKQAFEQIDEKLDSALSIDRWRARVIAAFTGRSQAEILLKYRPRFRIEAFLLADRTTGAPIARYGGISNGDQAGDDELFAGMLNAMLTFARNALRETEGGDLRRLDFGDAELFLRTSPTLLLAVRAAGPPPANIDQKLETLFVTFLDAHRRDLDVEGPIDPDSGSALSEDLRKRLDAVAAESAKAAKSPPWKGIAAGLAALLAAGWFGGQAYMEHRADVQLHDAVSAAVAAIPKLNGYRIDAQIDGASILISGLAPDADTLQRLNTAIAAIAKGVGATHEINVNTLPTPVVQSATAVAAALMPDVELRIGPLSSAVADIAFRTQDIEDAIGQDTVLITALKDDLSTLRAALTSSRQDITDTTNKTATALTDLTARVSNDAAASERRAAILEGAITAVEQDNDQVVARLATAQAGMEAANAQLIELAGTLGAVKGLLEAEGARISDTQSRLAALATLPGDTANNSAGLAALAAAIKTVNLQIQTELERVAAAERALAGLSATPAIARDNSTGIAALQTAIADVRRQIATARATPAVDPAIAEQLDDLETRAGEAIALLDQRIDRIARAAQPKAESPVEFANGALRPLFITFGVSDQPNNRGEALNILRKAADVALSLPARVKMRIVGYADSDGTVEANRITSQRRSDWALAELTKLGVPPERVVSVGRGAERLLSLNTGDSSPNRRVEFEAYYAITPPGN